MYNKEEIYNQLIEEKKAILEQIEIIDSFEPLPSFLEALKQNKKNHISLHFINLQDRQKKDLILKKINVNYIIYFLELYHHDLRNLNHLQVLYDIYNLREDYLYDGIIQLIKLDLKHHEISKYEFLMFILENYSTRLKKLCLQNLSQELKNHYFSIDSYKIFESFLSDETDLSKLKILLNLTNVILQKELIGVSFLLDDNVQEETDVYNLINILENIFYKKYPSHEARKYFIFNAIKDYIANLKIDHL